ncbi:phosphopantothenate--cysteine ligase [Leptospira ryugenii]|uniref:Phosphopantothenate--cysteine ligase n=1 Tax=Leptospira ryugenii TaxID=1917863 RepID=A0A2P2DZ94_9LEPT|nr:phosphopantothenoylcysteine decarboxylase [Leptospira ryugenii]GBF49954.1 phosphopantothenate--cysteine ligase [Leptospira ryugenii]
MASFKKIIITSGPTREWIDPVRYISNASSGKMGFHIAKHCLTKNIPEVVYIHGITMEAYSKVPGAKNLSVETTIQMRDQVLTELTHDSLLIMAAAPADFRPIMTAEHKIKKENSSGTKKGLLLELEENPDILMQASEYVNSQNLQNVLRVGFAAETQLLKEHALGKIKKKNIQWIVGNYVGQGKGFGEADSTITIFNALGPQKEIGPLPKEQLASQLVDFLLAV